jgi:hypothetical protein
MDICDVESEDGPLKLHSSLGKTGDTTDMYRVSPFTVASFSDHSLSVIPISLRLDRELS